MPVLAVMCEDDLDELDRRQLAVNQWAGDEFTNAPDNFFIWSRIGEDNILVTFPNQGEDKPGKFYGALCEAIKECKAEFQSEDILVVLDTAADMFGGNENIRREVNTFIKYYLGSLVLDLNATVVLLAHPSLTGLSSGSGLSGSTAWENSVRARSYLKRDASDDDIRVWSKKKSNYSAIGADTDLVLVWQDGTLRQPDTQELKDKINKTALKGLILDEVDKAYRENKPLRPKSGRKAYVTLDKLITGYKQKAIKDAFDDLVQAGNITRENRDGYKVDSRPNFTQATDYKE